MRRLILKKRRTSKSGKFKFCRLILCSYSLSDGVSFVKAILSEAVFNKMTQHPKKYDVIRLTSIKKVLVPRANQWIINIMAPFEIVVGNLTQNLGQPKDINTNVEVNGAVNFNQDISICEAISTQEKTSVIVD